MNENIIKLIKSSENIAVLTHISEDADALGSAAAFAFVLESMGKKSDVYISESPEERLSVIKKQFIVYKGEDTPKYDLCVCLDCGDKDRMGKRAVIFDNAEHTVNIDHHYTNPCYAEENLVIGDASSTAEILYNLFRCMDVEITEQIAECLYIAIVSDTGCFKYNCASPDTLRTAAQLMETGFDHAEICRRLFDTEKRSVMRFNGYVAENLHDYFGGRLCIATVEREVFEKYGVDENETGDMVNIPRSAEGCEIAVSVKESKKIKLSFRSNGRYDVAVLAEKFGGGGHKMAAGAAIDGISVKEAEEKIVSLCREIFGEVRL